MAQRIRACHFHRGPGLSSQHPCGVPYNLITPVPKDLTASSGLYRQLHTHTHIYPHVDIHMHIIKITK